MRGSTDELYDVTDKKMGGESKVEFELRNPSLYYSERS